MVSLSIPYTRLCPLTLSPTPGQSAKYKVLSGGAVQRGCITEGPWVRLVRLKSGPHGPRMRGGSAILFPRWGTCPLKVKVGAGSLGL